MADPNWLLSAAAQSSAALVAIVGGLIVTRLISLASERMALLRRREMLEGQRQGTTDRAESTRRSLVADDVDQETIEAWVDALLDADDVLTMEDLLEVRAPGGWLPDDYRPHVEGVLRTYSTAVEAMRRFDDVPVSQIPGTLDELPKGAGGPDFEEDRIIWERVLAAYRGRRTDENFTELGMKGLVGYGSTLRRLAVSDSLRPAEFIVLDAQRRDQEVRSYLEAVEELRRIDHELEVVATSLAGVQRPPGIWLGFGVLVAFALLGIVLPIVLMATLPRELSIAWRLFVVVGFVAGLSALLAYIGWFIRQLGAQSSPTEHVRN